MKYQHLRWVTVVGPAIFLGIFEYARHSLLDHVLSMGMGSVLVVLAVLATSYVFSHFIFAVIVRLQGDLAGRNQRLTALNRAGLTLTSDLALEAVLQRIVDLSRGLIGARYGAVGVLGEGDAIEQFITSGLAEAAQRRIGAPPGGRGLLRAVLMEGKAIRVADIAHDPRSVGFPPHHPPMTSFLGVPLVSAGRVIGNLYLADKIEPTGGPVAFSEDDERVLALFAAQAAVAIENARLYAAAARRERDALALYETGTELAALLDPDQIIPLATQKARDLIGTEVAGLSLVEEGTGDLTWRLLVGGSDRFRQVRLQPGEGIAGHVVQTGFPLVITDWEQSGGERPATAPILALEGLRAALTVPLRSGGRTFGVLMVACRAPRTFNEHQIVLLSCLANQTAVALENARLYEKVQSLAVLEERERIAREMHDGLGQVLGYVNTKTLAVARLLDVGKVDEARAQVAQLETAAKAVYADVREAILGLRTTLGPERGFLTALREYLEGFEQQSGIPVELQVPETATEPRPPFAAELQLLRIVQEALANVRKHAQASRAVVRFTPTAAALWLVIEDDGQGFDPARLTPEGRPRFGLQTMRERAEAIGGTFAVESEASAGTRVVIAIPQEQPGEVSDAADPCPAGR
ncbi:MAG: GAF domain-containing protein [Chloroflexi bacterium]|nr:GAF domain-containing protein [Chloroflexota bacterium]